MIYYQDEEITIRDMRPEDGPVFAEGERAQGWHSDVEKYNNRLRDCRDGKCVCLVAEYRNRPAGYVNVYRPGLGGPFRDAGIPEIIDFGVLQKYQRRGVGGRLMDAAERVAAETSDRVYLAVGLHNGYGSAQRMYVKRGYVPDGSGVWYRGTPCTPYDTIYTNDDDLVLYLSKPLARPQPAEADPPGVSVRVMTPADYDRVYALWMSCKNMGFNNLDDSREGIAKYLRRNPYTSFVAERDGALVGVILSGHDGRRGFIHHMAVAESTRRQGVASALLRHALSALKAEGIHKVALVAFTRNDAGNAFWQSQGFTPRPDLTYRNKPLTDLIRIDT